MMDAPPSTWSVWPVIKLASSMHRSSTALPISAGAPIRPSGVQPLSCQVLMAWNTSVGRRPTTLSSGADHIHGDTASAQSDRKATDQRIQRRFGGPHGDPGLPTAGEPTGRVADRDDPAAVRHEPGYRLDLQ